MDLVQRAAARPLFFAAAGTLSLGGLVLFGVSWLVYDHYRPWPSFHSEAVALGGLWLLGIAYLCASGSCLTTPRIALRIVLLVLVPWLQWSAGLLFFFGDALLATLYLSAFAVAVVVGYQRPGPDRAPVFVPFMHVLWCAALASAALGIAQWLHVQGGLNIYAVQTEPGERAMGNLAQPNQLATLLLMGGMAYTYAFEKKTFGLATYLVGLSFLTLGLLLTESRSGLLGLLVTGTFLMWKRRENLISIPVAASAAWVVGCFALRPVVPAVHEALLIGTGRGLTLTDPNSRGLIWRQVLSAVDDAPWFGYGWNQTTVANAVGGLVHPGSLPYTHAHNIVLDLLVWTGIPLGLALTGAAGWWLFSRARKARDCGAVYAVACLVPLVVHSLLEFPFAYAYFIVAAGVLVGRVESTTPGHAVVQVRKGWLPAAWILWALAGAVVVAEYTRVEEDFRVVRFENLRIGLTPDGYEVPDIHVLSQMGAMLAAARARPYPAMPSAEIARIGEAALRFPFGALALRHAVALGLNGDAPGASRQMASIRGRYGEHYYRAAMRELRSLQAEKYPQLGAVQTP